MPRFRAVSVEGGGHADLLDDPLQSFRAVLYSSPPRSASSARHGIERPNQPFGFVALLG